MVGIVIVSHSALLAAGVEELARQMTQTPVAIAIAAGINDPENPFGTDALQIQAAIESVYSEAGVIVLMDLGSAVMNAEMALEFLTQEQRKNVRLCAAPLVEGAIAAVVEAASNASLERVLVSARNALTAKVAQLGESSRGASGTDEKTGKYPARENLELSPNLEVQPRKPIQLTVPNHYGLHLRPAAKLVTTAARFQSEIKLQNLTTKSQTVSAKSINQVMLLGVRQGHEIAITAAGEDAAAALAALQELIEEQLGEAPVSPPYPPSSPSPPSPPSSPSSFTGIPASGGIAIAPAVFYQAAIPEVLDERVDNPQSEWQKLQQAIQKAKEQLENLVHREKDAAASIFTAHLLHLKDPELINQTQQLICEQNLSAAAAWKKVIESLIASYQALSDSYLQARASDVEDVGRRILRLLMGVDRQSVQLPQAGILVAADLTVSEIAQLKSGQVLGICTAGGSATSHSALLANQLGIPMVVGLGPDLLSLPANVELALDGATGQVWSEPSEEQRQKLLSQGNLSQQEEILAAAITRDGQKIPVLANILGVADARAALNSGAEGVGLLRTEFLYLERRTPPSEEEQLETIEALATIMGERPLTIRTLDIGGDKPVAYLDLPPETNPFLGWRGIRQSLDCPEILKTQLRAILRASCHHKIKLMFPMVTSVREVRAAKKLVLEVQAELSANKIGFAPDLPIGIMIEVPAAVTMADLLATEVDFFSIGTNDLSQYAMAADRTNPKVAALADALEPAVLRMIRQTVAAAHSAGITVSVCGQLASDPTAVPILLGLGVDELSSNPPAIPEIKARIARLSKSEAEALATAVLQLDSAAGVRECLSASFINTTVTI